MGPFLILTNIDGGDVEEICHFQIEKLRSHGNIFHIIANFVGGDLDEMIVFREGNGFVGYLVHRDFRGETWGFSDEKIDFGWQFNA